MLQVTRACSVHQTSPFMTGDFGMYVQYMYIGSRTGVGVCSQLKLVTNMKNGPASKYCLVHVG